jgi:hypothetical protein
MSGVPAPFPRVGPLNWACSPAFDRASIGVTSLFGMICRGATRQVRVDRRSRATRLHRSRRREGDGLRAANTTVQFQLCPRPQF